MKTIALSVLVVAAAFTGAAQAQEAGYTLPPQPYTSSEAQRSDSGWDADAWRQTGADFGYGLAVEYVASRVAPLLKAGDYAKAERLLTFYTRQNPRSADGHFFLGTVRMDLGKWDDARASLIKAERRNPTHPDPKSRLGVTYAKLGDFSAAQAERTELVELAGACNDACKLAPEINGGIAMIDAAIAEARR